MMLYCLGTGDGFPSSDRNHSAYLYRFAEAAVLIDCGEPLTRTWKAQQFHSDLIDTIILSHLHFDHVGGFFMFMQALWLERRQKPLAVYLPGYAIAPVRQMLSSGYLFPEALPFPLEFQPLESGRPIEIGRVRITPFPTTHLARTREQHSAKHPQPYEAFCFLLETDQIRIGHSADLGAPEDLEPLLKNSLDLLLCELAHFEPEHLFHYLAPRAIKKLLLVHVGGEYWRQLDAVRSVGEKYLSQIAFSFPQDGDRIPF